MDLAALRVLAGPAFVHHGAARARPHFVAAAPPASFPRAASDARLGLAVDAGVGPGKAGLSGESAPASSSPALPHFLELPELLPEANPEPAAVDVVLALAADAGGGARRSAGGGPAEFLGLFRQEKPSLKSRQISILNAY